MGAGEGIGEGKGVSVLDDSLSGNVEVGKGGAHSGEEEAVACGTRNLTFGGVVIDAFGRDDLIEEFEFACVDGFRRICRARLVWILCSWRFSL